MADGRFIEVGALNVVATPHPKGIYAELLRRVAGVEVGVWGSDYAKITPPRRRKEEPDILTGRILVWTRIDKDKRWIDKEKDDEATEDDKKKINIPSQLEPNFRSFHYALVESKHIVVVEFQNDFGERFGSTRVEKLFTYLLSPDVLGEKAPSVAVTVIPEDGTIKRILGIPRLVKLEIHLERPNPDDLSEDEARIMRVLQNQGAKRQDLALTKAPKVKSLAPNQETKTLAEVAAKNGFVAGSGRTAEGETISVSTKEHPKRIRLVLDEAHSGLVRFLSSIQRF